jgi:hypothetical protein
MAPPSSQARLYEFCPKIDAGKKRDAWSLDSKTERATVSAPVVPSHKVCQPCPVCGEAMRGRNISACSDRPSAGGGELTPGRTETRECASRSRGRPVGDATPVTTEKVWQRCARRLPAPIVERTTPVC